MRESVLVICSTSRRFERMIDAHRSGPVDHSGRLWAVLVLLIWHGSFVEGRIRPAMPEPVSRFPTAAGRGIGHYPVTS